MAFEMTRRRSVVLIIGKQGILIINLSLLEDCLPVQRQMKTLPQESHTGRVTGYTVDTDGGITRELPIESDILIRVRENATRQGRQRG